MSVLEKLMFWYASQCNGDWEHSFGITIETLDNPGWTIKIDLAETNLASKVFCDIDIRRSDLDWVYCTVSEAIFKAAGGPENLQELLAIFLIWAEQDDLRSPAQIGINISE